MVNGDNYIIVCVVKQLFLLTFVLFEVFVRYTVMCKTVMIDYKTL